MRTHVALAGLAAAITLGAAAAPAHADRADCAHRLERAYSRGYHKVRRAHGTRAPGRNIRRDGVLFHGTVFDATCGELRRSRRQLQQLLAAPRPYRTTPTATVTPTPPAQPPAGVATAAVTSTGGSANGYVNPACESGGDPGAVSASGQYRGKYQFDQGTWERFGGTGDPATASEVEQDRIAARVTYDAWPNC
jgi:hypothetical protein